MFRVGIDVGSTTMKVVVLDDTGKLIHSAYERHYSQIIPKAQQMLSALMPIVGEQKLKLAISGSAGMGMANSCSIPFVQEVYATRMAAMTYLPKTDTIIELGGEDAKILFLKGGLEVRMNGTCAGGTGAFIDQMATLLGISMNDIDAFSERSTQIYTIASRCGVFAKTDIQPLINQGAKIEDIASSILVSVVNQTIAGLAQGRKIEGNVVYLGGPLTFIHRLRYFFDEALHTKGICPESSLYYVALGSALSPNSEENTLSECINKISGYAQCATYSTIAPLFKDSKDYEAFKLRHAKATVPYTNPALYKGNAWLGIDSGSTTIKLCLIAEDGKILLSRYSPNNGNPFQAVKSFLGAFYDQYPLINIAGSASTGYGEDLIRSAFNLDSGLVETQAHFIGAKHFMPNVDFIIDIGGQDIKCFKIADEAIDDIFLNEACSSGCGSFLQTFANAMEKSVSEFSALAIDAKAPVDLGSRCTVFMNSSVKQAQKDGATINDISAGLAISVVKNALYKVIRTSSAAALGKHIVVQGGTFLNDAVLRAFEMELGQEVVRPAIAGLMGAFGAALYAQSLSVRNNRYESSITNKEEVETLEHSVQMTRCQGCANHCLLTINRFGQKRRFISGNRCERPTKGKLIEHADSFDIFAYKQELLSSYRKLSITNPTRGSVGLPLALNMYELLPFWHTFFSALGYRVVISPTSSRELYIQGQGSIPSDTVCFPAKLVHGHIDALVKAKVDRIFYPCMSYNVNEGKGDNHFNCPIVAYYPEVIAANQDLEGVPFIHDFMSLDNPPHLVKRLTSILSLPHHEVKKAVSAAYNELARYRALIVEKGEEICRDARQCGKPIIVLAGRPYHVDPEINHSLDRLIISLGAAIISEDSVSGKMPKSTDNVLDQWTYHARLYDAARFVAKEKDMNLVQMVSFGCGLDAVTTDEVKEILRANDKIYTQIKIDEITNMGAVKIRMRSLFAALEMRK